ncbi:hypothetical protein [Paenibacillus periandrae]|uniref:hypothetical protein n=1 Tax=Paenibacillus periandrae TaxID=1761741 RepID=UPI001F092735|nr:hypothetical protein [Paenibacillus periandrae]
MVMAKGKATIGTIAVGEKNVKIVMIISKKDFFRNARFFEDTSEEVEFALGDNQMSLDDYFDEEAEARQEDARRAAWLLNQPKKIATVDGQGIVQSLEPIDDGQAEMQDQNETEDNAEGENVETDESDEDQREESEFDSDTDGDEEDLWPDPNEDNNDDDLESSLEGSEPDAEQDIEHEPTSKEVDAYIIQKQPKYDDIEYDFAELLVRKNESNETWREIANSFGISTGVLTAELSTLRKRVKQIIIEQKRAA